MQPRCREAGLIAGHYAVHAAIDVSDGLSLDLARMMKASGTAALLDLDAIPIHPDAVFMAARPGDGRSPLDHALGRDPLLAARQHEDATEPRGPIRRVRNLFQEPSGAPRIVQARTAVARGVQAGCAAQSVDLQARVVGQRRTTGETRDRLRLLASVLQVGGAEAGQLAAQQQTSGASDDSNSR